MKRLIGLLVIIFFAKSILFAGWVEDKEFRFKINIPFTWQQNSFNDGTDRVYAFVSADENLAIRIRAFEVGPNVTLDIIESLFRSNILGQCEQLTLQNYNLNGYNGKLGAYRGVYNGISVGAGAFYTIQNGIAYIVWSLAPVRLFDSKINESDAITNTFTILSGHSSSGHGLANLFHDSGLGYRINYPSNWTYVKTKPHIVVFSGQEGTPAYYTTVNIQNLASSLMGGHFNSVSDVVSYFRGQLVTGAQNVNMSNPELFEFASGGNAVEGSICEITYYRQGQNFKQLLIVFPRHDHKLFYAFMYTADVEDYDNYSAIALEMLGTWVIE